MTTQPAGEHNTGSLDLAGEGNAPEAASPISDALVQATAEATAEVQWSWLSAELRQRLLSQARSTLEAAYPAIRQQVAEEIAIRADQIAENYQATAVAHRDLSDPETPKGQRHRRTAHAFRNKADGAWAVAHAVRAIGGEA